MQTYHPPEGTESGAGLLIFPGGGYGHLAPHEGEGYARWFTRQGITCHVLRYRLGSDGYRHPAMLLDAARALRWARLRARQEGRDPGRVGVIGSSAGGHLATLLLTRFDPGRPEDADPVERESARPDLGILCYPVVTMQGPVAHAGSRDHLLGKGASEEQAAEVSGERHVTAQTPPCFIWHTAEDAAVPVDHALLFAGALRRAAVPFELHIYERGRHGLGLRETHPEAPPWEEALQRWLGLRGFMTGP